MASEKIMTENIEQLKLDVGSIYIPKTVSDMLADVSIVRDFSDKLSKLDFYVRSLEEEMRKIDAFKRELPYCMHILEDGIETLKKEKMQLKGKEKEPVMEEVLMPLEDERAKASNDISEKKYWMSCVQLWSTPIQYEDDFDTKNQISIMPLKSSCDKEENGYGRNLIKRGGAFVPFKKSSIIKEEKRVTEIPVAEVGSIDLNVKERCGYNRVQPQQHRKQRRCWSPELHRRFLDALIQLGGPQTATPKQIREVMNVDGLTNDEVKSHLQKYRIHIRKLPSTSADSLWWFSKEHGESSKRVGAYSGSPQDHLHERGLASANGGDSMEDEEHDASQNHTWKAQF